MLAIADREYWRIFKESVCNTVFRSPLTTASAVFAFAMTLIASCIAVRITDSVVQISAAFRTPEFSAAVYSFLRISFIAICFKYLPRILYAVVLQEFCRVQFIRHLGEYLNLGYPEFRKKTPGEIRYSIFLKSFSSVMCANLLVFETPNILGTAVFSFLKIGQAASFVQAALFLVLPCVYFAAIAYYIGIKLRYQTAYLEQQEKISSKLYDKLINYDIIKTYNLEETETANFYGDLKGQMRAQIRMGVLESQSIMLFKYLLLIPYIIMVVLALVQSSQPDYNVLFKTTLLHIGLSSQLKRMGDEFVSLMMYLNQIKYTDIERGTADDTGEKEELRGFRDSIELRDVTLYHDERAIVSGINATIRAGEKI
ncbi:hypothetical protein PAPHI01_2602, partial [Pancytospora philotis]